MNTVQITTQKNLKPKYVGLANPGGASSCKWDFSININFEA